jgi:hypothetical protein
VSDATRVCRWLCSTTEEYRSGNKVFFVHLPIAELRPDGTPAMNPYFTEAFVKKFVNKMSRVILCCQDGEMRTELAAKLVKAKLLTKAQAKSLTQAAEQSDIGKKPKKDDKCKDDDKGKGRKDNDDD